MRTRIRPLLLLALALPTLALAAPNRWTLQAQPAFAFGGTSARRAPAPAPAPARVAAPKARFAEPGTSRFMRLNLGATIQRSLDTQVAALQVPSPKKRRRGLGRVRQDGLGVNAAGYRFPLSK